MSLKEINKLKSEKADLIAQYISLKKQHQELFFNHEELKVQYKNLKVQMDGLQKENAELKLLNETDVHRENKQLLAKVKQMRRSSALIVTPQNTPSQTKYKSKEYEVEKLLKHRGRKDRREFLVRWKHFSSKYDSWERETYLSCPKILSEYKSKHNIA